MDTAILIGVMVIIALVAWWINRPTKHAETKEKGPKIQKQKFASLFDFWMLF